MIHIVYDLSIKNKFEGGVKYRDKDISEIIIHGTGGGNTSRGMLDWMLNGERQERYKQGIGLFHYLIDRQGWITEIIPPEYWVYHSGSGKHDMETIGIELINPSSSNLDEYTPKQYDSLNKLLDYLCENYYIKIIQGHGICQKQYSGTYKNCPGNFDWNRINREGWELSPIGEKLNTI